MDDRRVPIIRVNGMARGIEVASAGTHVVKFYLSAVWFSARLSWRVSGVLGIDCHSNDIRTWFILKVRSRYRLLRHSVLDIHPSSDLFDTRTVDGPIQLGSEKVSAINLIDVKLNWRRTDSTEGRELFTRGVPVSRLPIATDGRNELPLHIGDLVYAPNVGLAEIDMRGHFRPVSANDGDIVTICSAFGALNTQSNSGCKVSKSTMADYCIA